VGEDRTATEQGQDRRRVTVAEAAEILGITAEAVRTRIKRGKLDSVKDPPGRTGTVYVLLEADQTGPNTDPTSQGQDQTSDQTQLVVSLREQVAFLQGVVATRDRELELRSREAERYQQIVAGLTQANTEQARAIRAIEAPASQEEEFPEAAETVEEESGVHERGVDEGGVAEHGHREDEGGLVLGQAQEEQVIRKLREELGKERQASSEGAQTPQGGGLRGLRRRILGW
jgi:hypothetical protein